MGDLGICGLLRVKWSRGGGIKRFFFRFAEAFGGLGFGRSL